MKLPVIIPLGRGLIPIDIIQDIELEIYIINDICENENKRIRESHTKNRCRDFALNLSSDYIVFNDSDLKHLYNTNFSEMKNFLKNNKEFGAVSLLRANTVFNHICNGVVMFRFDALKSIDYGNNPFKSSCKILEFSLRRNNWNYKYLDEKIRIEEVY
jgi:hypothetical protein